MTTTRQDAWTLDEDLMLAEVVLRHIRDGGTQLAAFEEVGQKLSRTAAACGFRWNSYVRKQYKSAIEMAKSQRKKVRKQETEADAVMSESMPINETLTQGLNTITFNEVISFLKSYENSANETDLKNENEKLTIRIGQLEQHIEKLQSEKETLHRNLQIVEEDYMALIEMMERARKMIVLRNDEPGRKANFQMNHNSHLEKIEK
ncbi:MULTISPECIES: RsfA family transcriptional regulator [Bacillaceae]|uniref:RsfA family transcriptional regulator n=1 Tax=Bacillaceae TaxID=186817 RepID=UPI000C77ED98|nr:MULTISPECIES: RsfA family transcriptional regulator [Bacillaceae]PLR69639.1 RsfA family transcriptional regulator [Bacillus sp. UMB0893]